MFVIPSNVPPHRPQPLASSFHRFAMALAIGAERWRASDLELRIGSPSFTSGTLQRFHERVRAVELFFVIGADAFAEIESRYTMNERASETGKTFPVFALHR